MIYDYAVVGAGPVGLSLALGLSRAGKSVLVLEKKPELSLHSKAPAIWPRTQEVLAGLGVIDAFLSRGILLSELCLWDADSGKALIRLPIKELHKETRFAHMLILPQSQTEKLLYEALSRQPSAEIRFTAEVLQLAEEKDFLNIQYQKGAEFHECQARWLAGCDGAHSKTRELLKLLFEGETYPVQAALADIRFAEKRTEAFPRITNAGPLAIAIRIDPDLWRLILPYKPDAALSLDERIKRSTARLFSQAPYEVVWKSEFHLHRRLAETFVSGRVVLAGDAAHLNSPVGGQGMNAGIQDTEVLVPCLIRALERNDPSALREYAARRQHAVRRGVNAFTNHLTQILLFQEGRFVKLIMKTAHLFLLLKPLRHMFLKRLAMLHTKKVSAKMNEKSGGVR